MYNVSVIGDVHLGKKFNSKDIPLNKKGLREKIQYEIFSYMVEAITNQNNANYVVQLGDLYDSYCVNYSDLMKGYKQIARLLTLQKDIYLIAGNHDLSKDLTKVSAFEILEKIFEGNPFIHFVKDSPIVANKSLFVPYTKADMLEERLSEFNDQYEYVFGHFEEQNFEWLKKKYPLSMIYTGHIHKPSVSGNLRVVGSIMPFTFAEDANNNFMKTCTLAEYLEDEKDGSSESRCYRIKLNNGEELPVEPKCLQMSKYIEGREDTENIDIDVSFEPFDFDKLLHEALDDLGLYEEINKIYLDNKMEELSNV